jgi:N-acetylglucosaminyldiphosphoundecaprenol N-acetyl-beta-D-mannosaminyltransferase
MMTSVFPLALGAVWRDLFGVDDLHFTASFDDGQVKTVVLAGYALEHHVAKAISVFREAVDKGNSLSVDVSRLKAIDPRFFGLLLMVRKQVVARGGRLQIVGASAAIRRAFRLNRFNFLLGAKDALAKRRAHYVPTQELAFMHPEVVVEVSSTTEKF